MTLLRDGEIIFAADEERFSRKKHDSAFPLLATKAAFDFAQITIAHISTVAFYEKPFIKFERILRQHLNFFPKTFKTFQMAMPSWLFEKIRVRAMLRKHLNYRGDVLYIDHHLSHAASAFLPSPFQEAAILTVDGVGEWTTTAMGKGSRNSIDLFRELRFPHSLGLVYSTLTAYLGFSVNNSEYKVMGLSAYGESDKEKNPYYVKMQSLFDLKPDGSFKLKMKYFTYEYSDRMPSQLLCELFDGPIRKETDPLEKRHKDIAAALQIMTEEIVTLMLGELKKVTGFDNVVLSGGVALNSVCNGKLLKATGFKNIWIQPNAGDGGSSMGAALFAYHSIFNNPRQKKLEHAYLGPEYSSLFIESFLKKQKIVYQKFSSRETLLQKTAELILENQVVGWFQGRMEWGPRALGARSILANPRSLEMQEILNEKVKHRENFRPFAPAVCMEDAQTYFECDEPIQSPTDFMLMVYPLRKEFHSSLPAVTHVDGSGRLQTIRYAQNPLYYDLIKSFGKLSGIPMLINTSFNIRGEPIVCKPEEAYRCMMGTGIDVLVMEDFIIYRNENPKDMWDSESIAHD